MNDTATKEFVEITLGGKVHQLKPSRRVIQTLSQKYGGVLNAAEHLKGFDFDAACLVLALGLGLNNNKKRREDFQDQVYDYGLTAAVLVAIDFLTVVSNGGRTPDPSDDPENSDNGQPADHIEPTPSEPVNILAYEEPLPASSVPAAAIDSTDNSTSESPTRPSKSKT